MRTAYVDESEPDQRADPGVYMLAAALVVDDDATESRAAMRGLLRPGRNKVHWNREPDRHLELAKTVSETCGVHVVVVRADDHARVERRRRLCLERLLHELETLEVTRVVLEARQAKQNAADMAMLDALRARRIVTGELRMLHIPGPSEPLLWMPDVVAGAYGAHRQGDSRHVDMFGDLITVHTC